MQRAIAAALFFIVFLGLFYGMHLYVFLRLGGMWGLKASLRYHYIIMAVALSYPLIAVASRFIEFCVMRWIYTAANIWIGMLFLLFSALIVHELVRPFLPFAPKTIAIVILASVMLISLVASINALFIVSKEVDIPLDNLKEELKIVQLSDIHVGMINNDGYLRRIVEKTNALEPDLVLITGDLVDGSGPIRPDSYAPLKELNAPTYLSAGNHERYEGIERVVDALKGTGVRVLRDEVVKTKGIQLVGVDDPGDFPKNNHALAKLKINKSTPSILMQHTPGAVQDAQSAGIDLMLSGHTHNGQIIPFNFIVKSFFRYIKGYYKVGAMHLYVSPGTGTWGPPMRLGSRSEITLFLLTKQS